MSGWFSYVGDAGADRVTKAIADAKAKAYDASAKASDTGAATFATHANYGTALRANKAAQAAWANVKGLAGAYGRGEEAQDAQDRLEELAVALAALWDDFRTHAKMGVTLRPKTGLGALVPKTTGGKALLAGAVAVAAKLLGWW